MLANQEIIAHSMHMNDSLPSTIGRDARSEWLVLLSVQEGVIDKDQARRAGFSDRQIVHRVNSGRWQRIYPGVYATFSGRLSRNARLWAAVRWAGDDAMLSHETAAEVQGMFDRPLGETIHITVPLRRRPAQLRPARGITVHRSDRSRAQFAGPFKLPRTRIEDTVLDLVSAAPDFDQGYAWISRAVARKLVSVGALRAAVAERSRVRWRQWLNDSFEESRDGVQSSLERRYVRDVERAHQLPASQHQARRQINGKTHYKDSWYPEYRLAVEMDGPAYHQNEQVQRDKDRDNANLAADDVKTFRFGPVAVTEQACGTAAMVAVTLQRNGWRGSPRPCRRSNCVIGRPSSGATTDSG
jgi:very-short-patch-repair endonuclease